MLSREELLWQDEGCCVGALPNLCARFSGVKERVQKAEPKASIHRSHLSLIPLAKLFPGRNDILVYNHPTVDLLDVSSYPQRRPGQDDPHWKIPVSQWPSVLARIDKGEPLRKVAEEYNISYEAIRRVICAASK
jgi:hypothetical protein